MPRLAFRPLTVLAVLSLVAVVVGAQAPTPTPLEQATARIVVRLLEQVHMAKPKINDEIAVQWCKNFIKDLDPQKVYFEKADVDEFMAQATTLDDKIKEGNLEFAARRLRTLHDTVRRAAGDHLRDPQAEARFHARRVDYRRSGPDRLPGQRRRGQGALEEADQV